MIRLQGLCFNPELGSHVLFVLPGFPLGSPVSMSE